MNQLGSFEDLLDLQQIDLEIDRLLKERESLPELEEYKVAHERSTVLAVEKRDTESRLREMSLELDRESGELELAEAKLGTEQNRLYAGGLSARDATFLRQEVEMLNRKNEETEGRVLELMELKDSFEQQQEDVTVRLAEVEKAKAVVEAVIKERWAVIDARVAKKEVRKADIVPLVEGDLLDLYETLRPTKEGVAVGRLKDGVCGGCHLRLTAAEQIEIAKGDPVRCLHCRRILVI